MVAGPHPNPLPAIPGEGTRIADFDNAAARAICRRHAKSFYFASHFLPKEKRQHAYAVYAFCRLLDDAVDEAADAEARVRSLVKFDEALDTLYDGQLPDEMTEQDGALRAFAATVQACRIPKKLFQDLAEGCRMDLTITQYADWPALKNYCYHVAGVVGVIMCYVFDLHDQAAHALAIDMGNAMQLTNILRDVKEDFDRGRVYVPQDELARFGYTPGMLAAGMVNASFVELMKFQIARARDLYAAGARGLHLIPNDGSRFTAAVMSTVYGGILDAIERQRYDVFSMRARLNGVQKLKRLFVARRMLKLSGGISTLLLSASLACLSVVGGCVIVPQATLSDGTQTPHKQIEQMASDGLVAPGRSSASAIARSLLHTGTTSRPSNDGPALYESTATRQLAVLYQQPYRGYGITLNQHFLYLPMPMFGARWQQPAAVILSFDGQGVLHRWTFVSEPDLTGFDLVQAPAILSSPAK